MFLYRKDEAAALTCGRLILPTTPVSRKPLPGILFSSSLILSASCFWQISPEPFCKPPPWTHKKACPGVPCHFCLQSFSCSSTRSEIWYSSGFSPENPHIPAQTVPSVLPPEIRPRFFYPAEASTLFHTRQPPDRTKTDLHKRRPAL